MDAVITYVDGTDPLWQRDFAVASGGTESVRRYRDWGTLPYLLRGIGRHLPFVETVYLGVARESQVPDWADRSALRIVLHRDILPEQLLPTFNSTTIELFLHRIEGLSEQYLYFNDDFFPVRDSAAEDFFPGGRPAIGFHRHLLVSGLYKRQSRNAWRFARTALGLRPGIGFRRPQHTCSPMLRSVCDELFDRTEQQLLATATPLRMAGNLNQYVYLDYALLAGKGIARALSNRHISLGAVTPERLSEAILKPDRNILCINDVEMNPKRFEALRTAMLAAFQARFPEKSRFER